MDTCICNINVLPLQLRQPTLIIMIHNLSIFSRPWKKGNPDNFAGTEHCAEFVDSELNDVMCNSPINYICEKKKCKL